MYENSFRVGMGAEAIRELLRNVGLDDAEIARRNELESAGELTDEQARLYQNGQVVPAEGKGWVLACFAGIPLGWGKVSDGMMKNHYPKGLRR